MGKAITKRILPSQPLTPFIKYYLYVDMDCVGKFKMVSIPDIEMYFLFRSVRVVVCNSTFFNPKVFIGGIQDLYHDDYSYMYETNVTKGFVIVFKPMGIYQLFGVKIRELANYLSHADEIMRSEINQVWERLILLSDPQLMKLEVERFLLKYFRNARSHSQMINHIFDIMEVNHGMLRQNQLCNYLKISQRKLQRRIKEEIGFTAKELLQIYRFNYVLKNINLFSYSNLTELSYLCDYFDQSHFIKDFKRVTGQVPKVFVPSQNGKVIHNIDNRSFYLSDI
jgi:AraC-like DNA-binding protein